ncbi:MAG TPA: glycosyltransferase family 2 protein [Acetobacteraceae bacterium]|nr:glycosyltransferase family 2 protein [Acetobacteraceae bacterium]
MATSSDEGRPGMLHPAMIRPRPGTPLISVIVPVFNEEAAILPFLAAADAGMGAAGARFEYIFINDGSRDATLQRLLAVAADRSDVTLVNFSRNFGKEAAMTAGLDFARGDAVVLMDVDLQDPPDIVGAFVARWREGFDIAYGVRESRSGDSALKRFTAGLFYGWFNRVSDTPIPPNVGDFRLLDRRVVEALRRLPERGRFMKGLFAWVGFPAVAVSFERPARVHGSTSWNYWRLWNFALEGLVSFSTAPLRIWSYVGGALALAAVLYALAILVDALVGGVSVPGYASLILVLLLSLALNLISLGMIGEYVGRLFLETKQRPVYLVEGVYRNGARVSESEDEGSV